MGRTGLGKTLHAENVQWCAWVPSLSKESTGKDAIPAPWVSASPMQGHAQAKDRLGALFKGAGEKTVLQWQQVWEVSVKLGGESLPVASQINLPAWRINQVGYP